MSEIVNVKAREILDSRGNPTLEVDVILSCGCLGRASVPSGASVGKKEALELRDVDNFNRYNGKGVLKAVDNVNNIISNEILGIDVKKQAFIDNIMLELDGTFNKSRLGSNSILGVSMAVARAASNSLKIPLFQYIGGINSRILPIPMMNIINGGVHAHNNLDIQEFMILPIGAKSFSEAVRIGSEVFYSLKSILKSKGLNTTVGDEGGFAPNLKSNEDGIILIIDSIKSAGYHPGKDVVIALDVAATELYDGNKYKFILESKYFNFEELVDYYFNLVKKYPIISIEDGLAENDWDGWIYMTNKLKNYIQIVGDDIFVTNSKIFAEGIKLNIANSIIIKLNQIGTLTETIETIQMAKNAGYLTVISHRSGETEDNFISDLSVGVNSLEIKTGSLSRSDRISKYNQLIRIEEFLGKYGKYVSKDMFKIF